ncbi:hypothetical protein OAT13_00700 [Gammaproteobacteria bacterium]|nr:hypothetical protein [Gammaproteobacteria bacterium]
MKKNTAKLTFATYAILFTGLIFSVSPVSSLQAATYSCVRDGAGAIVVSDNVRDMVQNSKETSDSCKEVPDAYKVKFYRFALCPSNPLADSSNSLDSCVSILSSDTGVDHIIEGLGTGDDLKTDEGKPTSGSYSHIAMIFSNELAIKNTELFDSTIIGRTGSGTSCWTIAGKTSFSGQLASLTEQDTNDRSTLAMNCGTADAAAPMFNSEVFDSFGEDETFRADTDADTYDLEGMQARLLKADNKTTSTSASESARMMMVIVQDVTITDVTSSMNLAFKLTDAVSIDLELGDDDNIYALKNGADPFQVVVTVKE